MKLKLLISFFLLLFSLVSCKKPDNKVGLFLYDANDTFIASISNEIDETLNNYYDISIYDAKRSQTIQNKQIINMLEHDKPNVLLVNIVDRMSAAALIQKANQYDTPIIFFNREPVKVSNTSSDNIYYVGTNPVQEGINQGIMAEKLMEDPTNINKLIDKNNDNKLQCIFIQGERTHQDTERRTFSCINYLKDKGYELDILAMDAADWNREKGEAVMEKAYQKFGDQIEFVFSNNDDMALGAIDYLSNNNLLEATLNKTITPFPILGVDGTQNGLDSIDRGLLYGTTINDSNSQVQAIHMLIKLINGELTRQEVNDKFNFSLDDFNKPTNNIYISGKLISS